MVSWILVSACLVLGIGAGITAIVALVKERFMLLTITAISAVILLLFLFPWLFGFNDIQKSVLALGSTGATINWWVNFIGGAGVIGLYVLAALCLLMFILACTPWYNVNGLKARKPSCNYARLKAEALRKEAEATAANAKAAADVRDTALATAAMNASLAADQAQEAVDNAIAGESQLGESILYAGLTALFLFFAIFMTDRLTSKPLPEFVQLHETVQRIKGEKISSTISPVFRLGLPIEQIAPINQNTWIENTREALRAEHIDIPVKKVLYVTTESDDARRQIVLFTIVFETDNCEKKVTRLYKTLTEPESAAWAKATRDRLATIAMDPAVAAEPAPEKEKATSGFRKPEAKGPPEVSPVFRDPQ